VIGPGARGPMHCRPRCGAGRRQAAIGELVTPEYDGLPIFFRPRVQPDWRCRAERHRFADRAKRHGCQRV